MGIHDDFFELGGYSLLAAQLVTQLRSEFGVDIGLQQFFEACTPAELAEAIDELQGKPPVDQTTLLHLLDRVECMSDDEAAELLTRLGRNGELPRARWTRDPRVDFPGALSNVERGVTRIGK